MESTEKKPTTIKLLLCRSAAVAVVLAIVHLILGVIIFGSKGWPIENYILFCILLAFSLLLLDFSDGRLVWRLNEINSRMASPLCWLYLIIAVTSITIFCWMFRFNRDLIKQNECMSMLTMYLILNTIFFFRYLVIVVKIIMRDED
jgi:hypothetical protein